MQRLALAGIPSTEQQVPLEEHRSAAAGGEDLPVGSLTRGVRGCMVHVETHILGHHRATRASRVFRDRRVAARGVLSTSVRQARTSLTIGSFCHTTILALLAPPPTPS